MKKSKPDWLKVKIPHGSSSARTNAALKGLNTICKSAVCPNKNECFSRGTATFLILGNVCTRDCGFCAVTTGSPEKIDTEEPKRIAHAIKTLNLKFAVITSVNRDDLDDGGADTFRMTVKSIRTINPECGIEILIPDFRGDIASLELAAAEQPDIISHNLETIERLYPVVRGMADYRRSLAVIKNIKRINRRIKTKSGIMVGMGEKTTEIEQVMTDLRKADCDILTIGQYLQPTKTKLAVYEYLHPDRFTEFKAIGEQMGFSHVESGPLVRSSYYAERHR